MFKMSAMEEKIKSLERARKQMETQFEKVDGNIV